MTAAAAGDVSAICVLKNKSSESVVLLLSIRAKCYNGFIVVPNELEEPCVQ